MIVSAKDFNLSNGTMSFQGKSNASFSHIVIPLQDCVLKEQNTESSPKIQENNNQDLQKNQNPSMQD